MKWRTLRTDDFALTTSDYLCPQHMKILLIGQGIAGTMLAWALHQRGVQVRIADGSLPGNASLPAAGIINPVTGKRFVKSWRLEEFFPAAKHAYQALEQFLKVPVWQPHPILRLLGTAEESNDWAARCALPDYADYLGERRDAGAWQPFIKPGLSYGVIHQAARVHFPNLIGRFRQWALESGIFENKVMDYDAIPGIAPDYDAVVFCEGFRAAENPFFPELSWQPAKGEALLLRLQNAAHITDMLKKTMTLVPMGEGVFWAGGSYQWHYPDLLPSEAERNFILRHVDEMLAAPFEIIGHVAGVRPAVKDRRPYIGVSKKHSNLFIFNGLGTKGALLAPYWAEHLAAHLLQGLPLDAAVDTKRSGAGA